MANWIDVEYPEPELQPVSPASSRDYARRLEALQASHNFDGLAVYGDREHFANLAFLTGYDPRFEEALLLVGCPSGDPVRLLVGNEGWGYAALMNCSAAVPVKCQTFSLQGQPRGKPFLSEVLDSCGFKAGQRLGLIGTKTYGPEEVAAPELAHDVPAYIVDALRDRCGHENVVNATGLLTDPGSGIRTGGALTTARDIAEFEYAAEVCYSGVRRMLNALAPGISETEAAGFLSYNGAPPLSYHIAIGFGEERVSAGLGSPDPESRLSLGDPITFGFGVWGGNVARTGFGVTTEEELPASAKDYVEDLAVPYLKCLRDWYSALQLGATGGQVCEAVRWFVEDPANGVTLNPGHLLHLDEWPSTPFYAGSKDILRSGTFIQCDIIAAPGAPLHGIHTEDGLVLADAQLRSELARDYPEVARRIERRRAMVALVFGAELPPEVLPLSSAQAQVCPFPLSPHRVLTLVG